MKEEWKRYWIPMKYLFGLILSGWIISTAMDFMTKNSTPMVVAGVTAIALVLLFWWNHFVKVTKCIMEGKDEKSKDHVTGTGSDGADRMSGVQSDSAGGSGNKD